MRKTREATNRILEMIEEGILDPETVVKCCLCYMSEDDVADMARSNDIEIEEQYDPDNLDNDTIEEEGDPNGDWYDTSAELE